MVEEKEPTYFKEFRELVIGKFSEIDSRFEKIDKRFDKLETKIETEIRDLAISTANEFRNIDERSDKLESEITDIRISTKLIEQHIGRYEVRSTAFEEILLKDFKPRILALEKLL